MRAGGTLRGRKRRNKANNDRIRGVADTEGLGTGEGFARGRGAITREDVGSAVGADPDKATRSDAGGKRREGERTVTESIAWREEAGAPRRVGGGDEKSGLESMGRTDVGSDGGEDFSIGGVKPGEGAVARRRRRATGRRGAPGDSGADVVFGAGTRGPETDSTHCEHAGSIHAGAEGVGDGARGIGVRNGVPNAVGANHDGARRSSRNDIDVGAGADDVLGGGGALLSLAIANRPRHSETGGGRRLSDVAFESNISLSVD